MKKIDLTLSQLDKLNTLSREQCIEYKFSYPPQKGWKKMLRAEIMDYNAHHKISETDSTNTVLESYFEM